MNCPKCDSKMETFSHHTVEIDRCTGCHGIWFDLLEEEDLKQIAGSEIIDIGDAKLGKAFNNHVDIKCPKCNVKMIPMVDHTQPHIWYESCPVCYGKFFDAGEFKDLKRKTLMDRLKQLFTKERK